MCQLTDDLGVVAADPELTASDNRCVGLLAIAGKVVMATAPPLVAMDVVIGAVGGAEIFRPITGGAGRPMLRINVLI